MLKESALVLAATGAAATVVYLFLNMNKVRTFYRIMESQILLSLYVFCIHDLSLPKGSRKKSNSFSAPATKALPLL